jgi:general secretion pathway protein A
MFLDHFSMTDHPFSEHTPTDGLLEDDRMKEGLARLKYFTQEGSLALITGHTGVGKSSLIRLFLQTLSRTQFRAIYIYLSQVGSIGLLKLIVTALGEIPKRGKERLYLQIFERVHNAELTTVVVLDEAQFIDADALTDIRLLVSSQESDKLKIVLAGQETLRDQLRRSRHQALVHRLTVRYHVPPLSADDTAHYIDHQLRRVGSNEKLFTAEAKKLIHDYATGLPRQINNMATACLIHAATEGDKTITEQLVVQVSQETTIL